MATHPHTHYTHALPCTHRTPTQVCCNSAGYLAGLGINTTDGKFAYMGSRAAGACAAVFNLRRPAANATLVGIKGTYGSDFLGSIQFSWAGVPLPQLPAAANNASSPVPAEQADNNSTSAAAMVTVDSVEIIQGLEGLAVPAPTTATITLIGDAFSVLNAPGGYSSLFGGSRYGAGRVAMVASEQMVTSCCRAAAPETLDTLLYNKILWAARLDVATPNAAKFPNKLRIRVSHPMYSPLAQYVAKMVSVRVRWRGWAGPLLLLPASCLLLLPPPPAIPLAAWPACLPAAAASSLSPLAHHHRPAAHLLPAL